jgi:hypothetical protein
MKPLIHRVLYLWRCKYYRFTDSTINTLLQNSSGIYKFSLYCTEVLQSFVHDYLYKSQKETLQAQTTCVFVLVAFHYLLSHLEKRCSTIHIFRVRPHFIQLIKRSFFSRGSTVLHWTSAASHIGGFLNYLDIWYDSLDEWSARHKASTYTGQHRKTLRNIHALIGFEPTIPATNRPRPTPQTARPLWPAKKHSYKY